EVGARDRDRRLALARQALLRVERMLGDRRVALTDEARAREDRAHGGELHRVEVVDGLEHAEEALVLRGGAGIARARGGAEQERPGEGSPRAPGTPHGGSRRTRVKKSRLSGKPTKRGRCWFPLVWSTALMPSTRCSTSSVNPSRR